MQHLETLLAHYGWEGTTLVALLLAMWFVQLRYYLFVYGPVASYRNNRRPTVREAEPPVSVVVPMFSEDYAFVEERLPLILAQEYRDFEVVLVYVGSDGDFYEDLQRLRHTFPQIAVTKIHLDPRFPISRKMALNVGIKSARNEHLVFSSTDAVPRTDRWLSLMAGGFRKGDIVLGYCGIEPGKGVWNRLARTWRMMHSADWLAAAVRRRPYRGTLHNLGITKALYFGANGFSHLNMNISEDDLFMQRIMTAENVSIVLSPRASLRERPWGGFRWWFGTERYYGSAIPFYPSRVRSYLRWEPLSRTIFLAAACCALAVLPPELKIAAGVLVAARYAAVLVAVRRLARRLGEQRLLAAYFLYDLLSPVLQLLVSAALLRKDARVWR